MTAKTNGKLSCSLWSLYRCVVMTLVRPYIYYELPGWGKLYAIFVGDYRRNWLWEPAGQRAVRNKITGSTVAVDLGNWADRATYFLGRWYDLNTQLLIRDLVAPGDTVVDVGANNGAFVLVASSLVGGCGKVLCFEPNPSCVRLIEQQLSACDIANVDIYPVGLSDSNAELTMTVPFINSGEGTFGKSAYPAEGTYTIKASVVTGDEALRERKIDLIKIDVEGFECKVLKGLERTLSSSRPIVITEVVAAHLMRAGSSAKELLAFMRSKGYEGFKVSLRRRSLSFDWRLEELNDDAVSCDAVWFSPGDIDRRKRKIFETHGQIAKKNARPFGK
jgi:FkbM family methyltransferase